VVLPGEISPHSPTGDWLILMISSALSWLGRKSCPRRGDSQ
jgi:hypothetical protein